jgi:hypothetical protein
VTRRSARRLRAPGCSHGRCQRRRCPCRCQRPCQRRQRPCQRRCPSRRRRPRRPHTCPQRSTASASPCSTGARRTARGHEKVMRRSSEGHQKVMRRSSEGNEEALRRATDCEKPNPIAISGPQRPSAALIGPHLTCEKSTLMRRSSMSAPSILKYACMHPSVALSGTSSSHQMPSAALRGGHQRSLALISGPPRRSSALISAYQSSFEEAGAPACSSRCLQIR